MMKKLLILLACSALAFQTTSCTSKDSAADSEVAADVDSADLEKLEGDEALDVADDSLASDQLPEEALGETAPAPESIAAAPAETTTTTETATTTKEETLGDDVATTEKTDVATSTETLPADPFAEAPPATEPATAADSSTTVVDETPAAPSEPEAKTETAASEEPAPKKAPAPLQKVATAPWKVGNTLYNTIYFARPGDTLKSISQMIYGADKTKEIKKGNPLLQSRAVKPGDKVYYNSPNRPDDASKVITYYEDNGMAPEVYVAKPGDDIKKVSKEILGYDNAWKEVWASNSVESKGSIAEGTELRYWRGGQMAQAPAQPQAPSQEIAASEPQAPAVPAPPQEAMPQQAQQEIPPPPMPPEQAQMDMPPPPPPDVAQDMAPPPPPPPEAVNPPAPAPQFAEEEAPQGMDQDTTMALGVVGIAAAGLAILIVMRKKRKQRELEQQGLDNTHVGT
ncbi:hypothetical protein ACES2L_00295 [Bdellovibrio bacteriovorus]